jgi:ribosomal protein S18 acetylase RimI-like enzyme
VPFRPPTAQDADAIVALLVACDIEEFGAPDYDHDALMAEWATPGVDVERDGFVADGAYGLLVGTDLRAWVHPERRGAGLGTALAERLEARARERGLDHVQQQVACSNPHAHALLEGRGYAHVRSYAELRLPDSAVGGLPASDRVRPYDGERDEAAVQALMEEVFEGDVGRLEPLEVVLVRNPDTTLWFVADAPEDGGLAGAVRSELRAAGFITGYVSQLGVRAAHRGQGLGAELLGAAARALVEQGAVTVRLHVRSSNPDALRFYRRLGFTGDWIADEYRLDLRT